MLDVAHSSRDPTFGSPIPAAVSASSNVCMQQQVAHLDKRHSIRVQ